MFSSPVNLFGSPINLFCNPANQFGCVRSFCLIGRSIFFSNWHFLARYSVLWLVIMIGGLCHSVRGLVALFGGPAFCRGLILLYVGLAFRSLCLTMGHFRPSLLAFSVDL